MEGNVWKFGDDIDTDIIIPGRYLVVIDPKELAKHVMEGLDPDFHEKVSEGDFIVGGKNFGCGSSREHAPLALKGAGISAVIAESFARIFYRNSINVGIPLLEAPGISKHLETGEKIEVDMDKGVIRKVESGEEYKFQKLPEFMLEILDKGGLIPYVKEQMD
jgi:3-isopropylmalate/(R)-2-methylmalate dehydratase small subunit